MPKMNNSPYATGVIESLRYAHEGLMIKKYPLGCIPSEYDPRDYSVAFSGNLALKWPESDIIPEEYPNYDQGKFGTCVMQSLRYGPHCYYDIPFGINFIYGLARFRNSGSPGMAMRDANDFLCKNGIAPLFADPKEYEMPQAYYKAKENEAALLKAAEPYKGWTYARLHTIDEIKGAIRDRRHITFRMEVSKNGLDKANFFRGDGFRGIGHHAMVIRGYCKRKNASGQMVEAVVVRNSWGEDWGDKGDCYMLWKDVLAKDEIYTFFPPVEKEPIPVPVVVVRRTLRDGMTGPDVKEAQTLLRKHGFYKPDYPPTELFDTQMRDATIAFQKAKGLVADCIIGAKTWKALDADYSVEPINKATEFIEYLKTRVGDIYVWGAQGQNAIDEAWIRSMETSKTNADRAIKLWKARVKFGKDDLRAFDCSGLVMYYLMQKGLLKTDTTANGLYAKCKKITRDTLQPGDLLFKHNGVKAVHVGVYIGDGKWIEAQGRDQGVVMRDFATVGEKYWNKFGRLPMLEG